MYSKRGYCPYKPRVRIQHCSWRGLKGKENQKKPLNKKTSLALLHKWYVRRWNGSDAKPCQGAPYMPPYMLKYKLLGSI